MKLSEIFSQLTFGELKQVTLGGHDSGAVQSTNYSEIIAHINLGLLDLYKRFPIVTNSLILQTVAGRTRYELSNTYAFSYNEDDYHIVDSLDDPFASDILRINEIKDIYGNTVPINDRNRHNNISLSAYNVLTIPWATGDAAETLVVEYRAKPTTLSVPTNASSLDLTKTIALPDTFVEPLLAYVEYRVHKARGGEAGLAQARLAKGNYDALCMELERENVLHNNVAITNEKLHINGWA